MIREVIRKIFIRRSEQNYIRRRLDSPYVDNLVIYATSFCNAKCKMCDVGVGSSSGIVRPLAGTPKYMSLSLLEKILRDDMFAGHKPNIYFMMTEPLLAPELPRMMKLCKDLGHKVYVTTNGLLLARRAEEISPYLNSIQVSLDGLKNTHDAIRGDGFFDSAVEGVRKLRAINDKVEININYTIFGSSYTQMAEFAEFIDSLGVKINKIKYQLLDFVSQEMMDGHNLVFPDIRQTVSTSNELLGLGDIDFSKLYAQIQELKAMRLLNVEKLVFKPPVPSEKWLRDYFSSKGAVLKGCDRCYTPWMAVAINTGGKVFWHTRCFNDYVLGDAAGESIKEIFYGEKAEYFRKKLKENKYCFPACTRCCGVMPIG